MQNLKFGPKVTQVEQKPAYYWQANDIKCILILARICHVLKEYSLFFSLYTQRISKTKPWLKLESKLI